MIKTSEIKRLGLEAEYDKWKNSLRFKKMNLGVDDVKAGMKFKFITEPYCGYEGKIVRVERKRNKLRLEFPTDKRTICSAEVDINHMNEYIVVDWLK